MMSFVHSQVTNKGWRTHSFASLHSTVRKRRVCQIWKSIAQMAAICISSSPVLSTWYLNHLRPPPSDGIKLGGTGHRGSWQSYWYRYRCVLRKFLNLHSIDSNVTQGPSSWCRWRGWWRIDPAEVYADAVMKKSISCPGDATVIIYSLLTYLTYKYILIHSY